MHPRVGKCNHVNAAEGLQLMSRWLGLRDQDNSVVAGIGGQAIQMWGRPVSFARTERRI
jgi:hypothetical protein